MHREDPAALCLRAAPSPAPRGFVRRAPSLPAAPGPTLCLCFPGTHRHPPNPGCLPLYVPCPAFRPSELPLTIPHDKTPLICCLTAPHGSSLPVTPPLTSPDVVSASRRVAPTRPGRAAPSTPGPVLCPDALAARKARRSNEFLMFCSCLFASLPMILCPLEFLFKITSPEKSSTMSPGHQLLSHITFLVCLWSPGSRKSQFLEFPLEMEHREMAVQRRVFPGPGKASPLLVPTV